MLHEGSDGASNKGNRRDGCRLVGPKEIGWVGRGLLHVGASRLVLREEEGGDTVIVHGVESLGCICDMEDVENGGVDVGDDDEEELSEDDDASDHDEGSTDATSADENEEDKPVHHEDDRSSTLFVRNLPFSCSDEDLEDHFSQFGSTRYARIVLDHATERPKGTGFVCFYSPSDADQCIRGAPRSTLPAATDKSKAGAALSVLQDETLDPSGRYTIDGRVLQVSRAVAKSEANKLTKEGIASRFSRDKDKRRLYLLSEGTINSKSALYQRLSPTERQLRLSADGLGTAHAMAENEDRVVEVADEMAPGDEAPPGTPGTGEDACPKCDSSGKVDGEPCPDCGGTGRVVKGISGA